MSCFEEVVHEQRVSPILERLEDNNFTTWQKDPPKVVGFSLLYDRIYFFTNWLYYTRDVDLEYCMSYHARGIIHYWRKAEVFALPPLEQIESCHGRTLLSNCLEFCQVLTVFTSPILGYYCNIVIDDRPGGGAVWPVAAFKFFMLALVRFPALMREGSLGFSVMTL